MLIKSLNSIGLCRSGEGDRLLWEGIISKEGLIALDIYSVLIKKKTNQVSGCWFNGFWKTGAQIKMILFLCIVWKDKNLTWKNVQKRGWKGPGICSLLGLAEEDNEHIFYRCRFAIDTMEEIGKKLQINIPAYLSTEVCLRWWLKKRGFCKENSDSFPLAYVVHP